MLHNTIKSNNNVAMKRCVKHGWLFDGGSFNALLKQCIKSNEAFHLHNLSHVFFLSSVLFSSLYQLEIECTWMRETNIDWIFQGPACAVLLINLVFLFRIMWVRIMLIESL